MGHFIRIVLFITMASSSCIIYANDCPDVKKLTLISNELRSIFNEDFCTQEVNTIQVDWIINKALPQVMTPSFLGVEPPGNWRELADEILVDCYSKGNLCNKTIQEQFSQCAMAKMPIILFQLGPWIGDNCVKLNKAVIDDWQARKSVITGLIVEYKELFNKKRNSM